MNGAIFIVTIETLARTLGLPVEGFQLQGGFLDDRGLRLQIAHPALPYSPPGEPLTVMEAKFELIEDTKPEVFGKEDEPKPEVSP